MKPFLLFRKNSSFLFFSFLFLLFTFSNELILPRLSLKTFVHYYPYNIIIMIENDMNTLFILSVRLKVYQLEWLTETDCLVYLNAQYNAHLNSHSQFPRRHTTSFLSILFRSHSSKSSPISFLSIPIGRKKGICKIFKEYGSTMSCMRIIHFTIS